MTKCIFRSFNILSQVIRRAREDNDSYNEFVARLLTANLHAIMQRTTWAHQDVLKA